jgi:hypothetical protein
LISGVTIHGSAPLFCASRRDGPGQTSRGGERSGVTPDDPFRCEFAARLADGGEAAPTSGRATFAQPAAEPASPSSPGPELPKFAERADDPEAIKQAVEDAASQQKLRWALSEAEAGKATNRKSGPPASAQFI